VVVFAKAASWVLKASCRSGGGQLLQEREKPQLAENQEPEFRQDVIRASRQRSRGEQGRSMGGQGALTTGVTKQL
jgi:hypothetical protein